MLPNGGFPPIKYCKKEEKVIDNEKEKKGFFYSKKNSINIRDILKKNIKKTIDSREEEELDEI